MLAVGLSCCIQVTCTRTSQITKMAEVKSRRVAQTEDLSNVEFETSEDVEVIPTFDNMGLRDELLRGIYAYGTIKVLFFYRT